MWLTDQGLKDSYDKMGKAKLDKGRSRVVDPETNTIIERVEDDRSRMMSYMHYRGENRWRLTDAQWKSIYLMADGFGVINEAWARDQAWDWSHVRDSSPQAIERMWFAISQLPSANKTKQTTTNKGEENDN